MLKLDSLRQVLKNLVEGKTKTWSHLQCFLLSHFPLSRHPKYPFDSCLKAISLSNLPPFVGDIFIIRFLTSTMEVQSWKRRLDLVTLIAYMMALVASSSNTSSNREPQPYCHPPQEQHLGKIWHWTHWCRTRTLSSSSRLPKASSWHNCSTLSSQTCTPFCSDGNKPSNLTCSPTSHSNFSRFGSCLQELPSHGYEQWRKRRRTIL